jgi:hypothetical protein
MATSLETVEQVIPNIQSDMAQPIPDVDAMENLKFSECLSLSIAAEVVVYWFKDRTGVIQALGEPRRMARNNQALQFFVGSLFLRHLIGFRPITQPNPTPFLIWRL